MEIPVLDPGALILLAGSERHAVIKRLIGSGGQGSVYEIDDSHGPLALKVYFSQTVNADPRLAQRLDRGIALGPPDNAFLWPLDRARILGRPDLVAYVMPMRESRFVGMKRLISAPPDRVSPKLVDRAIACLLTAECFHKLHARGQCYQDISFGNLFLDPLNGEIAICDNDNVDVNGAPAAVYGTRKFMAPEIVRREALPSTITDLYSMAVMFFYILMAWHPLDGRREHETLLLDGDAEVSLYGTDPLFMFDETDESNGPVAGVHDPIVRRWYSLPRTVRTLLTRAFTTGLKAGIGSRVLETEWIEAFATMRDTIIACPNCTYEQVCETASGGQFACVACQTPIAPPAAMLLGRGRLLLSHGAKLRADRIGRESGRRRNAVVATVEPHPRDPSISGLRNLGTTTWTAVYVDGRSTAVAPGQAARLAPGCRIDFGTVHGLCLNEDHA